MSKTRKRCIKVLGFVFLLSLIPLYLISLYDFQSADDFFYLGQTLPVWEQTGSIIAVLQTAVQQTIQRYFEWQGNFSFIFLTFLQPASQLRRAILWADSGYHPNNSHPV